MSCKTIIPLKCNLRIKVQMYQKQQKGEHVPCKKQEQVLIWRVFKRSFEISKDVYTSKNSSTLKMLYLLMCTYLLYLHLCVQLYTDFRRHFSQYINGFSGIEWQVLESQCYLFLLGFSVWKNLIPVPLSPFIIIVHLYYFYAIISFKRLFNR